MAKQIQNQKIELDTTWTIEKVLNAIRQHELGDFSASAKLADHYQRDERISACTEDRISALTGEDSAPFAFELAAYKPEMSKAVAEQLGGCWDDFVTDEWLRVAINDLIHLGISFFYVQWETTDGEWKPLELTHFHASAVKWDDEKQCYIGKTRDSGDVEIRETDPNWLVISPGGKRSYMRGAVRSLGIHFLLRTWDFRDYARYCERHGMPILKVLEPAGLVEAEKKEKFFQDLRDMSSSGVMRLPQAETDDEESYDVDYLEAKTRSYDAFVKFGEMLNTAIAIRILGQNLSTEIGGGSFAAAGWHARVKQSVIRGDASSISAALRKQIVVTYGEFNFPSFEAKAAPWPRWRLVIAQDMQALAATIQVAYQGLAIAMTTPTPIDYVAFANKFGMPILGEGEEQATNPAPEGTDSDSTDQETDNE